MKKRVNIRYGENTLGVDIPRKNFLYAIGPKNVAPIKNEEEYIRRYLKNPISCPPLSNQLKPGMKVVILVDDLTRPTPQDRISPILLDQLK